MLKAVEAWLQSREALLLGDEAALEEDDVDVDAMLAKHGELESLLEAHSKKMHSLRRLTQFEERVLTPAHVEEHFQRFEMQDEAERQRLAERQRQEEEEQLQQQVRSSVVVLCVLLCAVLCCC